MTEGSTRISAQRAVIAERTRLQAEAMTLDSRLRNFTPLRDHLVASGQDANAAFRRIHAQRDHLLSELRRLTPPLVASASGSGSIAPPAGSLLSRPLAPLTFGPNGPAFGFSGVAHFGRAEEESNFFPPGTAGTIQTLALKQSSPIYFTGDIYAFSEAGVGQIINPGTFDPNAPVYSWLHSWSYQITFPAPPVESLSNVFLPPGSHGEPISH